MFLARIYFIVIRLMDIFKGLLEPREIKIRQHMQNSFPQMEIFELSDAGMQISVLLRETLFGYLGQVQPTS